MTFFLNRCLRLESWVLLIESAAICGMPEKIVLVDRFPQGLENLEKLI